MTAGPQVQAVALVALRPAPWNPRSIKDERFANLCASIDADPDFLWRRPVLAQADGTIYAGNMRYRAAQHLGLETIPAIVEDIPDQLARERALRDNAQWGEWEEDELAALLAHLRADGSDLDILGFDERELQKLLDSLDRPLALTDPDEVPALPAEPVTQPGDLWLLDPHRLLCGDARDAHDVSIVMGDEKAACIWTDPPYGVSYVGGTKKALTLRNDDAEGLNQLLAESFAALDAVLLDGGPVYIAHPAGAATSKPVALIEAMLRNSSRTGDVVLDAFLGSGSTLIACERLGRRCYGIELDPRYVDVAVRRWEAYTGQKAAKAE